MHDVGKAVCMARQGNMHGHDVVGEEMARKILERLKFSNAETERICGIVRWHMVDINGDMRWNKLRWFAVEHLDIADDLCAFKRVDSEASCGEPHDSRLKDALEEVRRDGTPLALKDLKVSGEDLIALGVAPKDRAKALKDLWRATVYNLELHDREKALQYLKKRVKSQEV